MDGGGWILKEGAFSKRLLKLISLVTFPFSDKKEMRITQIYNNLKIIITHSGVGCTGALFGKEVGIWIWMKESWN